MKCEYGDCSRRSTRHYHSIELCELHYLLENQVNRIKRVNIKWDKINRYQNIEDHEKTLLQKFKPYNDIGGE